MENYENVIYTVICGYGVPVGTNKIFLGTNYKLM